MKLKIVFLISIMALLTACADSASVRYGGSGPHYAKSGPPAHGYRHKHRSHDLSYDSGVGVYVVVGLSDHYFDDGLYFRYRSGNWEVSVNLNDGWHLADRHVVPSKLWKSKQKHDKGAVPDN